VTTANRVGIDVVAIAEGFAANGYAVVADYFDATVCQRLQLEAQALAADATAIDAGIGRGEGHTHASEIRQARIRWLDSSTAAQVEFLAATEALRLALNQHLFLGLLGFEAQLALTPSGGFYARHIDSFAGRSNRIVSLVAYLNDDWRVEDGGCLRVWPPDALGNPHSGSAQTPAAAFDVTPASRTLVLMRSETVPHQVLSSFRPRASIAGWFSGRQ
jgi:SM-20-related protein